ncbi:transcriptional regulator [Candidatus Microgenomates bacterium]|nr:transcriptional regulator [Candidatus Microgenomates bacterium]
MIEHLFGSKTRVKLLHLFLTNPNRSFYVREITRKINEQINSVRRELSNLLAIGIIKSELAGNRLYYEVNQKHKHYESLRHMFTDVSTKKDKVVAKSGGGDLAERFSKVGSIELAILTGSFVRNPMLPVDILLVGNVNRRRLEQLIEELETEEARELRYAILSREDFEYRLDLNDRFLSSILGNKKTVLIGEVPSEAARKEKVGA